MTTEAVLLLVISVFIMAGVYFSANGPKSVFKDAGPHLAGKIERSLSSGHHFKNPGGATPNWVAAE